MLGANELPSVGIEEQLTGRAILIDTERRCGALDAARRTAIEHKLRSVGVQLVFVCAFRARSDLAAVAEPPWQTVAWFSDEPDHYIEFNSGRILPQC